MQLFMTVILFYTSFTVTAKLCALSFRGIVPGSSCKMGCSPMHYPFTPVAWKLVLNVLIGTYPQVRTFFGSSMSSAWLTSMAPHIGLCYGTVSDLSRGQWSMLGSTLGHSWPMPVMMPS